MKVINKDQPKSEYCREAARLKQFKSKIGGNAAAGRELDFTSETFFFLSFRIIPIFFHISLETGISRAPSSECCLYTYIKNERQRMMVKYCIGEVNRTIVTKKS